MDRDSFLAQIKKGDNHSDIAKNVASRFDTSNQELGKLLLRGKNKKVKTN